MSDSDDPIKPYKVGYGKPPAEHKFPRGKSGNPKGRPIKRQIALTPREIRRAILSVAMMEVSVSTPQGPQDVPAFMAMYMSLFKNGMSGKVLSARTFIAACEKAFAEHAEVHDHEFRRLEGAEIYATLGEPDHAFMKRLNHMRKLTRRNI